MFLMVIIIAKLRRRRGDRVGSASFAAGAGARGRANWAAASPRGRHAALACAQPAACVSVALRGPQSHKSGSVAPTRGGRAWSLGLPRRRWLYVWNDGVGVSGGRASSTSRNEARVTAGRRAVQRGAGQGGREGAAASLETGFPPWSRGRGGPPQRRFSGRDACV